LQGFSVIARQIYAAYPSVFMVYAVM